MEPTDLGTTELVSWLYKLADYEPKNVDVLTNTFMITGELWNAIRLTAAEAADRIVELERRSQ